MRLRFLSGKWLAVVVIAMLLAAMMILSASGCSSGVSASEAGIETDVASSSTAAFVESNLLLPEGDRVSLAEAREVVDARIVFPADSVTGGVSTVVIIQGSEATAGVGMQFESGVVMLAGPLDENTAAPDYVALMAAEEADGVVFTDGRAHPGEVVEINGHETCVCPAGVQYFPTGALKGTTRKIPSSVMWYADGIRYFLTSETEPVDALVAIAESMK